MDGRHRGLVMVAVLVHACHLEVGSSGTREICESETFSARCRADEVIMMTHANYGRMRLGRCVRADLGYLGCRSDVLHLADSRCSGRRQCDIRVPDGEFDDTKPCFKELKIYMEVSYMCLQVVEGPRDVCLLQQPVDVMMESGFLASIETEASGCGSQRAPWIIRALPGQRINLTLIDFTHTIGAQDGVQAGDATCYQYGAIEDESVDMRMPICRSGQRVTHLYQSVGHRLRVTVLQDKDSTTFGHFLLKFEVLGCDARGSIGGCDDGLTESTTQTDPQCGEGTQTINCTSTDQGSEAFAQNNTFIVSQAMTIAVIVGVSVLMGLIIFCLGMIILNRKRAYPFRGPTSIMPDIKTKKRGVVTSSAKGSAATRGQLYEFATYISSAECRHCVAQQERLRGVYSCTYSNQASLVQCPVRCAQTDCERPCQCYEDTEAAIVQEQPKHITSPRSLNLETFAPQNEPYTQHELYTLSDPYTHSDLYKSDAKYPHQEGYIERGSHLQTDTADTETKGSQVAVCYYTPEQTDLSPDLYDTMADKLDSVGIEAPSTFPISHTNSPHVTVQY